MIINYVKREMWFFICSMLPEIPTLFLSSLLLQLYLFTILYYDLCLLCLPLLHLGLLMKFIVTIVIQSPVPHEIANEERPFLLFSLHLGLFNDLLPLFLPFLVILHIFPV